MANQKQQYGPEWQRAQMLKQNTVRVRFEHLNQRIQQIIGEGGVINNIYQRHSPSSSIRSERSGRAFHEILSLANIGIISHGVITGNPYSLVMSPTALALTATSRTINAKDVQKKHDELAWAAKKFGILQTHFENQYPLDWLNPTMVAETHPIFSVQRNGDIIFRRVTPKEFKLLKMQEKWIGKAGVNLWRWRGTLRKPLAPEVERQKVSERLRGLARRYLPMPQPRPALQPARKAALFPRMRPRHR